MDRIVCIIQPFKRKQQIQVWKDNLPIGVANEDLDIVASKIYEFSKKHQIKDVDLVGEIRFLESIEKQLKANVTEYSLLNVQKVGR